MAVYPKWIYHATEAPRIVATAAEHAAAGPGWAESPAVIEALEPFGGLPESEQPIAGDVPEAPRRRGRPRKVAE